MILEQEGEEAAKLKTLVPKCETCGKNMKPHCMFFDECYSEHYYRRDTVKKFFNSADAMIVIGTCLETNMAKQLVSNTLYKELPVIEVNLETAIGAGNNIQVIGKSEQTLPLLFKEYFKLANQAKS